MQPLHTSLSSNIFEKPDMVPTRDGFGAGAVAAGKADERVMVLSADLAESTRAEWFAKEFPHRFIEMGIAEQNMAAVASGLANYGKIPFITSYAAFNPGRNYEIIRTTIALTKLPVIVCGMHAGVSVGPDGATHQMLEDIALMRALPHMTVISPGDAEEARKATIAAAQLGAPVYMRFGREKTPVMTTAETPFQLGKAEVFWDSEKPQVAVFATGPLVHSALTAARGDMQTLGIEVTVVNVHTIKPLDTETVVREAQKAGAVVTVEEHQVAGGLGSAIAEVLAQSCPVPMEFVGVRDAFGQSGTMSELIAHYKMGPADIGEAIRKVVARKH
jgi:transketolase